MSISKIRIKSFKSIIDQTVELGQLNVLIGRNGAGKSNFLEAIAVLSCALSGRINYSTLSERGARLSAPEVFKSSFKGTKRSNAFSLDAEFHAFSYRASVNANTDAEFKFSSEQILRSSHKLGGRSPSGIKLIHGDTEFHPNLESNQSIVSSLESLGAFTSDELQVLKDIQRYAIYSLSTPILRGVAPDPSNKEPLGLYGGGLATALSDVIRDMANQNRVELFRFFELLDWFKSIGTTDQISDHLQSNHIHTSKRVVNYTDKYMRTNFNNLYAYDVSEGALYVLFILILLLHDKSPNLFALDNVDSTLNPLMLRDMMRQISDLLQGLPEKQLIMTTHNPTTLDALDLFNDQHRLFVVSRNAKGHTEIRRIEPPKNFTRESWVEKYRGKKLSDLWLSGLLDGVRDSV
jgi:predicted ATPase